MRVKHGVHDPDFPELDLSGWTATVLSVDADQDPPNCELRWTDETLQRIDPAVRERCAQEDLFFEIIWLGEHDLEPDPTRSVEHPERPRLDRPTPPPWLDEQENRIRAALSVPIGGEIPIVSMESLPVYHKYLTARLIFPLACRLVDPDEETEQERVTLVGLPVVAEDPRYGLLAEIRRGDEQDFVPLWRSPWRGLQKPIRSSRITRSGSGAIVPLWT